MNKEPIILAIDTSCDETSVAVTCGRRVLANVISSQVDLHKKYGGVYPALAKRAHEERIDFVVKEALKRAKITKFGAIAVTQGPGLAIALEVGIKKAKEIVGADLVSARNQRATINVAPTKLIAINHLEGHLYSCLAQNSNGRPERDFLLPALGLIVSGGHTQIVLMQDHGIYELVGETLDDACGEALDKAAKILKLGYPGGPIIEKLSEQFFSKSKIKNQKSKFSLSPPLNQKSNLNFSYSGLKTQFLYLVRSLPEEEFSQNLTALAYTFQEACFEQIIRKITAAIRQYQPQMLVCGGGVIANKTLRKYLRQTANQQHIPILFPRHKNLITDNAAMIGVAAHYKYLRGEFVENIDELDRVPRLNLCKSVVNPRKSKKHT